jgi:hypothetical protein
LDVAAARVVATGAAGRVVDVRAGSLSTNKDKEARRRAGCRDC